MKKIILLLSAILLFGGRAFAQKDLTSWDIFRGKIIPVREMVKTEVKGGGITSYKLTYYLGINASVTTEEALQLSAMVEADTEEALTSEAEKTGDLLTYALVEPKAKGKDHRYLCWQARPDGGRWKVTLLYLEGQATVEELKKMFEKQ